MSHSNISEPSLSHPSKAIIKRNRFFAILIVLIIVLPMIVAYIMFHTGLGLSGGTTNNGILLTPAKKIHTLTLSENQSFFDELYAKNEHGKKWRLLIPVSASCNEACQNNLYLTRQVHIRLAEKGYRVERIMMKFEALPDTMVDFLAQEHPNTLQVKTSYKYFSQWLSNTNVPASIENIFYLVDQEGFAMMFYDASHTGQDLLDDVKKLLKFTYDK